MCASGSRDTPVPSPRDPSGAAQRVRPSARHRAPCRRALPGDRHAEIADDEPFSVDHLASCAALYVATDDADEPVGYALVELVDDHAHLEQLSVVPESGGQGVGTALIDAVVAWAVARGDDEVTLTTFRDVAFNAPLYAKRGFAIVDETDWTDGLRAVVAHEAADGLDITSRVVMRRVTS